MSKLFFQIHNKQNIKFLNKVKINITDFSPALGSHAAHIALLGVSGKSSHGSPTP